MSGKQLARLILQGPPRVGKTTAVERVIELLHDRGVRVGGFLTRELREYGKRVGFVTCEVDGPEAVIAHQDFHTPVRVGRFGVDVAAFERIALPALARALEADQVVMIDEVARMELASTRFVKVLHQVLRQPVSVIATVHIHYHPVTDELLRNSDLEIIQVTEDNRDHLPTRILTRLGGYAVS